MQLENDVNLRKETILPIFSQTIPLLKTSFRQRKKNILYKKNEEYLLKEDITVNNLIKNVITQNFPDDGFISEEDKTILSKNNFTWVLDPIDGTSNFANFIPFFCVSLALVYNNSLVFSVVFEPLKERYYISVLNESSVISYKETIKAEPLYKNEKDPLNSYSLYGAVFGVNKKEYFKKVQTQWLSLAKGASRYRNIGATALDIIYGSVRKGGVFFSLKVRNIDIFGALLFVQNLGYQFLLGENNEFLFVFPPFSENTELSDLIEVLKKEWQVLPLNSIRL